MDKDIVFSGITTNSPDSMCPDGELASAADTIPSSLGLIVPDLPRKIITLDVDERVLFVHRTPEYVHYITEVYNSDRKRYSLVWRNNDPLNNYGPVNILGFSSERPIKRVGSIGNTLIVLTLDQGIVYILWKPDADYKYLGQLPELQMAFSLKGRMDRDKIGVVTIQKDEKEPGKLVLSPSDELLVSGAVNKFVADYSVRRGRFMFPFLVRCALRLNDGEGSLVKHSAPVLMVTSDLLSPCICGDGCDFSSGWKPLAGQRFDLNVAAMTHRLCYRCLNRNVLADWADVLQSVDIFVSAPFYTYDQSKPIRVAQTVHEALTPYAGKSEGVFSVDMSSLVADNRALLQSANAVQPRTFHDLYRLTYHKLAAPGQSVSDNFRWLHELDEPLRVQEKPRADVIKGIRDNGVFYLLSSIPLDKVSGTLTEVDVPDNYLESLVTREVMTDDYDSHCRLFPQTMFLYNKRLNVADLSKEVFRGFPFSSAVAETGTYVNISVDGGGWVHKVTTGNESKRLMSVRVLVHLKKNGRDVVVQSDQVTVGYCTPVFYFYYPDRDAYQADIVITKLDDHASGMSNVTKYYSLSLRPHPFLNGAVYCDTPRLERDAFTHYQTLENYPGDSFEIYDKEYLDWREVLSFNGNVPVDSSLNPTSKPTPLNQLVLPMADKIYTSAAGNPFVFPLSGINTVGTGRIMALAAATTPLSEGQFGTYPLYAFTSEGIWAMSVNPNTGGFGDVSPLNSSVAVNTGAIVSTENSVLFFSKRGLMLLQGRKVVCISDELRTDGVPRFRASLLPWYNGFISGNGISPGSCPREPFEKYILNAVIVYDYLHHRIIVSNVVFDYAYVYDVERRVWGIMSLCVDYAVNAFPETLAVRIGPGMIGELIDFGSVVVGDRHVGSIVTRPLKFGLPDVFKTMRQVIVRGAFLPRHVQQVLYGSNDLIHWFAVSSSSCSRMEHMSGTPYKYFIVALVTSLDRGEYVTGLSVRFEERLKNKLR